MGSHLEGRGCIPPLQHSFKTYIRLDCITFYQSDNILEILSATWHFYTALQIHVLHSQQYVYDLFVVPSSCYL